MYVHHHTQEAYLLDCEREAWRRRGREQRSGLPLTERDGSVMFGNVGPIGAPIPLTVRFVGCGDILCCPSVYRTVTGRFTFQATRRTPPFAHPLPLLSKSQLPHAKSPKLFQVVGSKVHRSAEWSSNPVAFHSPTLQMQASIHDQ